MSIKSVVIELGKYRYRGLLYRSYIDIDVAEKLYFYNFVLLEFILQNAYILFI